jgi:hypothetical protein
MTGFTDFAKVIQQEDHQQQQMEEDPKMQELIRRCQTGIPFYRWNNFAASPKEGVHSAKRKHDAAQFLQLLRNGYNTYKECCYNHQ